MHISLYKKNIILWKRNVEKENIMIHNKNIIRIILRKDELNFCDILNFVVFVKWGLK